MNKILILFLLTLPAWGFSQHHIAGDTLYVWNLNGVPLYQKPSFSSTILDSLKLGNSVIVNAEPPQKRMAKKTVNNSFLLRGYWIQVLAGNKTGYIFGGDCYTMNPFPLRGGEKGRPLLDRFLGNKTGSKVVTKKYKFDNDTTVYSVKENITYYANGRETSYYFDGCSSDDYYFPSASLTTVYHLMMIVVSYSVDTEGFPEELTKPRLRGVWGKVYEFDGVGAIEPQLEVRKHGIEMRLSSCD